MKRFIIVLFLIFSVSLFAGEIKLLSRDGNNLLLSWEINKYKIKNYNDYVKIEVDGLSGDYGAGNPELPAKQAIIEIPKDAKPTIEILEKVVEEIQLEKELYPAQLPPIDMIGEEKVDNPFLKNQDVYESDKEFPGKLVELVNNGIMRGRNIVVYRVNPVQYIPKTKKLIIYKKLVAKVVYPPCNDRLANTDTAMDPIASGLILNYTPGSRAYDSKTTKYLIITHDDYYTYANQIANWKRQKGFVTEVVKVSEITSLSSPSVEAIKNKIAEYYPGLEYLLLIGDSPQIPLQVASAKYSRGIRSSVPSDLYYAMLEGDDYYPDIYVGRIPANSVESAETMVNKILTYDKNPVAGNWYTRFLLCGEFQYQYGQKNRAERLFCETAYVITRSLGHLFTFPNNTIGTGSSGIGHSDYYFRAETYRHKIKDPNGMNCKMPADWAANIQPDATAKTNTLAFWGNGAGCVQHRDHGSYTGWGKPSVSKADVAALNNAPYLPILFSINCLTGGIDQSSDCFVEAALKNANGGATAAIAATRVSYSWWNDTLCDGFYTCLFGTDVYDCMRTAPNLTNPIPASHRLGVILNYGKYYLIENYPDNPWNSDRLKIEFYLFHCFGDPEMMVRTTAPKKLDVEFQTEDGQIKLKVLEKNTRKEAKNLRVSFTKKDRDGISILNVGKTNQNGEILFSSIERGKVLVTITGVNIHPYQKEIEIK